MDQPMKKVKFQDLELGMTILEITGFDSKYSCLDSKSILFLQTDFKNATAVVAKDSGEKRVSMDALRPLEDLQKIVDIPADSGINTVVPGLGKILENYGFLEFMVIPPPEGAVQPGAKAKPPVPVRRATKPIPKEEQQTRLDEAKDLLDKVETATASREESSNKVQEMMDQGRAGKYSAKGAAAAVQEILSQGASTAMQAVASLKGSDQTYTHCVDMSVIFQETYAQILRSTSGEPSQELNRFTLIAGFMHDIGKSKVPKDILESKERFEPDSREMQMMRRHAVLGAAILTNLGMDAKTVNVAHYHHVKKNPSLTSSYPEVSYAEVESLTRLAAIVDVYQALIGKRTYKRNWVPGKAVKYLVGLRGTEFEEWMLDHFLRAIGLYPVGSLVRLSNQELAFIVKIAREANEQPVVVPVENAKGELFKHHNLVDLMVEPDLTIVDVVDHFDHYKGSEQQAYDIFRSIRLG